MKRHEEGRRILRSVRVLTVLALITVIVTMALTNWTLHRVRTKRAQAAAEQDRLMRTSAELREQAVLGRAELDSLLEESATPSGTSPAVALLGQRLSQRSSGVTGSGAPAVAGSFDGLAEKLAATSRQAQEWRASYLPVWEDVSQQRTINQVRTLITELRGRVESYEGRHRLAEAMRHRRWRLARGAEAQQLAEEILNAEGRDESQGANDFKTELAECARLVEIFRGTEQLDGLADFRENQIKPVLTRLARMAAALPTNARTEENLGPEAIAQLRHAILGGEPEMGGIFALRSSLLGLRRDREKLKAHLSVLFQAIETASGSFAQSAQTRSSELAGEMEASLTRSWRRLWVFGAVSSAFFLWLARVISGGIREQLKALDAARTSSEAAQHRTEQLLSAQQAAAAELARAHQGLQLSEQKFRLLSASAPIGIFLSDASGRSLYNNPQWLSIAGLSLEDSLGDGWKRSIHPDDADHVFSDWMRAAAEGADFNREFRFLMPDGEVRWVQAHAVPIRSDANEITGHVGTAENITKRKLAESALVESQRFLQSSLDALSTHIAILDETGRIISVNAAWNRFAMGNDAIADSFGVGADYLKVCDRACGDRAEEAPNVGRGIRRVMLGECPDFQMEYPCHSPAERRWFMIRVTRFEGKGPTRIVVAHENITTRRLHEETMAQLNRQLVSTSRQAGMAEVATSVLHNVGNVLNSVNVSATVVSDTIRKSERKSLEKVVALLRQHEADLAAFLGTDAKGKQIVGFLAKLAEHLAAEQTAAVEELTVLQKNIDHIKDVVAMQQSYAKVSGVTETLRVVDLIEDTLRMNAESLARHDVRVVREFNEVPDVTVDKHKLMQILVNLVRNAKHACDEAKPAEKRVTLRVVNGAGRVKISVSDNGVGIPPENLNRIFNHGFTTKKEGHGFGLHSGALAAKEMGGALIVHSEGLGRGATFTVELPLEQEASA